MQPPVGDDDASIGGQLSAMVELERWAVDIRDDPAGLGHDQGPGGMVPDLLAVVGPGGEPEVNIASPRATTAYFAWLSIRNGLRSTQTTGDGRRISMRAVPRIDRLAEPDGRRGPSRSLTRIGCGCVIRPRPISHDESAPSFHGAESVERSPPPPSRHPIRHLRECSSSPATRHPSPATN